MSDTPRTDAAICEFSQRPSVQVHFARQLERELVALTEEIRAIIAPAEVGGGIVAHLQHEIAAITATLAQRDAEVARLREERDAARQLNEYTGGRLHEARHEVESVRTERDELRKRVAHPVKDLKQSLSRLALLETELAQEREDRKLIDEAATKVDKQNAELREQLEQEREAVVAWKAAALSTAIYRADTEINTPEDYVRHQTNEVAALLSRADALETMLTSGLCSAHAVPDPINCDTCNKLKCIEGANLQRMEIIESLQSQLSAARAALEKIANNPRVSDAQSNPGLNPRFIAQHAIEQIGWEKGTECP